MYPGSEVMPDEVVAGVGLSVIRMASGDEGLRFMEMCKEFANLLLSHTLWFNIKANTSLGVLIISTSWLGIGT